MKILDLVILAGLLVFSFDLTFVAGTRGFFPLDQSIVFDGSYRILSGQIPYKDFVMPVGPVAFWLQAVFFKLFGVNYTSYVLGAATVNAVATAFSVFTLRLLFPSAPLLSYVAGLLTAVWFYPPFGTPYPEQTAFFFSLAAITLLLWVLLSPRAHSLARCALLTSGSLAALSLLSKQNAGLLILPLYPLLIIGADAPDAKRIGSRSALFFIGVGAVLVAYGAWVWVYSDVGRLLDHFIRIPLRLGMARTLGAPGNLFADLLAGQAHVPAIVRWAVGGCGAVAMVALGGRVFNPGKMREESRRLCLASVLCVYTAVFQYAFIRTAFNQVENAFPFLGIILGIGIGLTLSVSSVARLPVVDGVSFALRIRHREYVSSGRNALKMILCAGWLVVAYNVERVGEAVAVSRAVQDVFEGARFPRETVRWERLEGLQWGRPTLIEGVDVREDDVVGVLGYLKERGKNFFVFPDFTVFYGLLNVPSPQPLLWFDRGLTYRGAENRELDAWIVESLEKNGVEIVIIETRSFYGTQERLNDFPRLVSYVDDEFRYSRQFGIFDVYERRGGDRLAVTPGGSGK